MPASRMPGSLPGGPPPGRGIRQGLRGPTPWLRTNMLDRRIAHLDMDAFYASVELLRRPELRGRPVVIGGGAGGVLGRGVATTATYEARAFGVRSGMALRRARELCPQCTFLAVDFDEYRRYSRRFKAAVATIAPEIEDRGIDEVYLDLTRVAGDTEPLARAIKAAVREATGLSCSIGVAPNKLLAKIASDLDKPDGLAILSMADVPARIWPLPARRINGIGPKASARLAALGIRTVGELAAADPAGLVERFGAHYGAWLHEAAHGRDERPVVTHSEPRSRSRETTFERDLHVVRDRQALSRVLDELCAQVAADLAGRGYAGRTIGVKVRFDDFSIVTRDASVPQPTAQALAIRRAAGACLRRIVFDRRIRLLGVRVAGLSRPVDDAPAAPRPGDTLPLF